MKIRTTVYALFFCIVITLLLPGCNLVAHIPDRVKMITQYAANTNGDKSNLTTSKDVLNCFSKKDAEGLKALLCVKTQRRTDIDTQILAGFNFVKGKVISFNEHILAEEDQDIEQYKITLLHRSWDIEDIKTDAGEVYKISIDTYLICEEDKNREGISQITINSSDGKELIIGYTWPFYYSQGRDMSDKIVKALSGKDVVRLKSVFCSKTLGLSDINTQIQNVLTFFEGKATMGATGKIVDGHMTYDGNLDYHPYVNENEVVQGNSPIRTSITVSIKNIKTDAGRTYQIEFYADLLNKNDKACEGISQMTITSDDNRKLVIGEKLD